MALEIRRLGQASPVGMLADRRVFLAADRRRMVEDGDPAAAVLLATPGTLIPAEDAERLGLVLRDGRLVQPAYEVKAPPKPEGKPKLKKGD